MNRTKVWVKPNEDSASFKAPRFSAQVETAAKSEKENTLCQVWLKLALKIHKNSIHVLLLFRCCPPFERVWPFNLRNIYYLHKRCFVLCSKWPYSVAIHSITLNSLNPWMHWANICWNWPCLEIYLKVVNVFLLVSPLWKGHDL